MNPTIDFSDMHLVEKFNFLIAEKVALAKRTGHETYHGDVEWHFPNEYFTDLRACPNYLKDAGVVIPLLEQSANGHWDSHFSAPGHQYRHVCPACGWSIIIRGSEIYW